MSFFILFWGLLEVEGKLCVFIGIFQTYFLVSSVEKTLKLCQTRGRSLWEQVENGKEDFEWKVTAANFIPIFTCTVEVEVSLECCVYVSVYAYVHYREQHDKEHHFC